jgi:polar amino acid transport system substrate-binding protein
MKTLSKILAMVLLVAVLLTACAPKAPASHWEAIQKAGKLKIGTSADYPPFEFVDDAGEFAGFDVEIMKALGEKLGVEIEIVDMPFDSLIAAVQEGKIDMSVAAFNYSEERDEVVDFTIAYYNAEDGFLVSSDFADTISAPEDIAKYTVGAGTGTTQDGWIQENLVDTGILPADKFFKYDRIDQAALDVKSGRIDVLMAEAAVIQSFEKEMGGLKVAYVGQMSSGPVNMVIPNGDTELAEKLNTAIQELIDSGFIEEMAIKFMQ